jgi:hypothetical protein
MKYRKKPVVIQAWRWLFDPKQYDPPSWVIDALAKWPAIGGVAFKPEHPSGPCIEVVTLEGVAIARPGDWIIQGVQGELYPCKHDIFYKTYEPVKE